MELSLERKPITVNETILDINTEQAVESDMLLADYYPGSAGFCAAVWKLRWIRQW